MINIKTDVALKNYLTKRKNFADICNYVLYDGKEVIKEEQLSEKDTNVNFNEIELRRDLVKNAVIKTDQEKLYMVIGIENQSEVDYVMPVRTYAYDAYEYYNQVRERRQNGGKLGKKELLKPVITIVIYYGQKRWTGAKKLSDIVDYPKELKKYIPSYRMTLIEVNRINKEKLEKLRSEVKYLFGIIKVSNNKGNLDEYIKENKEYFRSVDETSMEVYRKIIDKDLPIEAGGMTNMCKGWDDMKEYQRKLGIKEGKLEEREKWKVEKENWKAEKEQMKTDKEKTIINLIKLGLDMKTISEATNTSIKKIKELAI